MRVGTVEAGGLGRAIAPVAVLLVAAACNGPDPVECTEFEQVFVWVDADGDGYGTDEPIGYVCTPGANQSTNNADCDDDAPTVFPGAEEVCDLLDNDCNDRIDEAQPKVPWYHDVDGDGFGSDDVELACAAPGATWIATSGDCDDTDPNVNPGVREVCNGRIDDDCDGAPDDADAGVDPTTFTRFYADSDGDGFGNPDAWVEQCETAPNTVLDDSDCDDTRASVNPNGMEVCNHLDDDCDTLTDDEDPSIDPATQRELWADVDGDSYGDANNLTLVCFPTAGLGVNNDDDCDDTDPLAYQDQWWYRDLDHDGFGGGAALVFQCTNPGGGLVSEGAGIDCDDTDASVYPDAPDVCGDGWDQSCDGRDGCDPECAFDLASYPVTTTFLDHQNATTMAIAWNGTSYYSVSGGGGGGMRMSEYDAGGAFIRNWATQPDFRSVFVQGDGTPELYSRAYNSQDVQHWNGNAFVNYITLTGINLGTQGTVVWDDFYGQFVATTDVPGQVPMFDVNGQRTQTVTLLGFNGIESQYPQGRSMAIAEGCLLTYYNGTLSSWDQLGNRVDQTTLMGAGNSFDSHFSLSYANGLVFVIDFAGGTWRGYDVGL